MANRRGREGRDTGRRGRPWDGGGAPVSEKGLYVAYAHCPRSLQSLGAASAQLKTWRQFLGKRKGLAAPASANPSSLLVAGAGFEPATFGL